MVCVDLGTRKITRMNFSRIVVLPKTWVNQNRIATAGAVSCTMNEAGDLVLSPVNSENERMNPKALERRAELAGIPSAPVPPNAITKGTS